MEGNNCSDITPLKQKILGRFFREHLRVSGVTINNNKIHFDVDPRYNYIDLFSGSGRDKDSNLGSPAIFLEQLLNTRVDKPEIARNMEVVGSFIDHNLKYCKNLQKILKVYYTQEERDEISNRLIRRKIDSSKQKFEIFNEDYRTFITKCIALKSGFPGPLDARSYVNYKFKYGLVYIDPYGEIKKKDFSLIGNLFKEELYSRVDVLINLGATTVKRLRAAAKAGVQGIKGDRIVYLDKLLNEIPKDCWCVRIPYTAHQWTFLFGNNYKDKETNKNKMAEFEQAGMYDITSPEGRAIFRVCVYDYKELKKMGYETEFADLGLEKKRKELTLSLEKNDE
jgi:three-Cys-motif partner protein